MIRHIQQPKAVIDLNAAVESVALKMQIVKVSEATEGKFNLCGQCCVAMVAETTLQEAIIACGAIGCTLGSDLMTGLRLLGVQCRWRRYYRTRVPEICIIRLRTGDADYRSPKSSHWVLRYYGALHNPAEYGIMDWEFHKAFEEQRIASLIEIQP